MMEMLFLEMDADLIALFNITLMDKDGLLHYTVMLDKEIMIIQDLILNESILVLFIEKIQLTTNGLDILGIILQ